MPRATYLAYVSKLEQQWLEVFRAGDYGAKGKYTAADLAQIAADYDPTKHESPLVIGHPEHDAPAYGWAESLKAEGDLLFAKPRQVDPAFESAVQAGRFKKRSIALYRSPEGKLAVRHIGFLGAMPPEVKGLADAHFGDEQFEEIEFSEESGMAQEVNDQSIMAAVAKFFGEKFGKRTEGVVSEVDVASLVKAEADRVRAEFTDLLKVEREGRAAIEAKFSDQQTAAAASAAGGRVATAIAGLKAAHHWLPAFDKMGVPQLFAALASPSVVEIEFGEGDAKKKVDAVALFAQFLEGLGKIVPHGQVFNPARAADPGARPQFNESPGLQLDPASVVLDQAVKERAIAKSIPYGDALKQLNSEGFKPVVGSAANGEV